MKKYTLLALLTVICVTFTACGSAEPAEAPAAEAESVVAEETEPATEAEEVQIEEPATDAIEEEPVETEEPASVEESGVDVDIAALYENICSEVSLILPVEMEDDFLENYYGIDLSLIDSYVCSMSEEATSAETIFIVKLNDEKDSEAISECVSMVRDDKEVEMEDYLPDQYEIVEKSSVEANGKYVWLVISENADSINSIIEDAIQGN